jgi:hypothetical protein
MRNARQGIFSVETGKGEKTRQKDEGRRRKQTGG